MSTAQIFSRSPDTTPIGWLITQFRKHLYIPDPPTFMQVFFGAVAANLIEGDPVWVMLVGPPSSGKSELLSSLLSLPGIHEAARINGDSAFLSGTSKKERVKEATGGLLRKVGSHGGIVINDFTSVLTLPKDKLDSVFAVFREAYIGRWTRDIGVEGGRTMNWKGKLTLLAGVTGTIDIHHEVSASLGERWLYLRMPVGDGWELTKRALNKTNTNWRAELQDAVRACFAGIPMEYGKPQEKHRELTDKEHVKIHRIAKVAALCRSGIVRDKFTRDIIAAREDETETRLSTALGQLFLGMEVIGVSETDRWKGLETVALDCMPKLRRIVIDEIRAAGELGLGSAGGQEVTYNSLAEVMGCSKSTAERTVEDLKVHGVVEKQSVHGIIHLGFTETMRELLKGWGV